jgi:integrase
MNSFRKFASIHGISPDPCAHANVESEPVWIGYLLFCKKSGNLIYESFRKYLSAIKSTCLSFSCDILFANMPLLVALKKAWRRAEGPPQKRKVPVTFADITRLNLSGGRRGSKVAVKKAMATFGFHTLARVKELTEIRFRNISILPTHVSIYLESSKTDPFGAGGAYLSISLAEWDLVTALLKKNSNPNPHGHVFPVKANTFRDWMSNSWGNGITGHSLRRGGAQYLFDAGTPLEAIQQKGRWRSNAWQRYIDVSSRIVLV